MGVERIVIDTDVLIFLRKECCKVVFMMLFLGLLACGDRH